MYRYVTEYSRDDGKLYGAQVDAIDWDHAQQICNQRGYGEQVKGLLYTVVSAEGKTTQDADQYMREIAASAPDPPTAEEFGVAPDMKPPGGFDVSQ